LLQAVAQQRFPIEGLHVQPTLSAGLCLFDAVPADASGPISCTTNGLVSRATQACALAQRQGGNRLEIYTQGHAAGPDAPSRPQDTLSLVQQGLRENDFQVLFQPFVDLRDRQRESYELLLRLRTAEGDPIGAADFLPVARQAALTRDIDRWMTGRALEVLDERRQLGSEVRLLIHQTAETLADRNCITWLRDELRQRLLVGTGLIFELNLVDLATDLKGARALTTELHGMGVEMCLARFGHNDASYKILRYLGAHYVKVAEKLLTAGPAVIATLVQRVHDLDARVIVPQVDDPRMISQPWLSGADFVQGNAIQHPQGQPTYDFSTELHHETEH